MQACNARPPRNVFGPAFDGGQRLVVQIDRHHFAARLQILGEKFGIKPIPARGIQHAVDPLQVQAMNQQPDFRKVRRMSRIEQFYISPPLGMMRG